MPMAAAPLRAFARSLHVGPRSERSLVRSMLGPAPSVRSFAPCWAPLRGFALFLDAGSMYRAFAANHQAKQKQAEQRSCATAVACTATLIVIVAKRGTVGPCASTT